MLTTRDLEPTITPPPLPTATRRLDPALAAAIQDAAISAADSAVKATREITRHMLDQALLSVEERLAGIEAPKAQVLAVSIDALPAKPLKNPAVPSLGRMLVNAKLGLNTMLVGPAGCGKTFGVQQLAQAMGLQFGHICFTSGASETWLFGRQTPNGFIEGVFSHMYRHGGVFAAEEFDAADANMLLALNTALENGHLHNPINGETYTRHPDFVFVATCNTYGKGADHVYTGRNRLDAATLDRFVCIKVKYQTDVEKMLCPDQPLFNLLTKARNRLAELKSDEIISMRAFSKSYKQLAAGIPIKDILESLVQSWPEELPAQVGLTAKDYAEEKDAIEEEAKRKSKGPKKKGAAENPTEAATSEPIPAHGDAPAAASNSDASGEPSDVDPTPGPKESSPMPKHPGESQPGGESNSNMKSGAASGAHPVQLSKSRLEELKRRLAAGVR